jgi:hypothetical protein
MPPAHEIRADFDKDSIVVYQAYRKEIALPAVENNKFVPPFSINRMTWIKPSFLWLMERSNWGQKAGQEYILAVRISRKGWEEALALGVLTSPEKGVYRSQEDWKQQFDKALVHIQWDTERSIRGTPLNYESIQVGLSRHIIEKYVNEWIIEIKDYTPLVRKIYNLTGAGQLEKAKAFLPKERLYPVENVIARRLGML